MFSKHIGRTIDVYVEDILVNSKSAEDYIICLPEMFGILVNTRWSSTIFKCAFGVSSKKFFGYMMNERGIEAPTRPKKVQSLTGKY